MPWTTSSLRRSDERVNRLRPGLFASLLAGLIMAGCAATPPQPESMRDPGADFASFATFSWAPNPGADGADQPLRLLDQNIRAAIAGEMQRRGYSQDDANPDLRIAYETASATRIEDSPVRVGVGMGSWGGSFGSSVNVSSSSVRNYQEGTLVIHAIDVARNAEVWQGRISSRIGKGSLEPAAVTTAVQAAMRDFPARQSSD
jgi:hypothetical protein